MNLGVSGADNGRPLNVFFLVASGLGPRNLNLETPPLEVRVFQWCRLIIVVAFTTPLCGESKAVYPLFPQKKTHGFHRWAPING